MIKIFTGEDRIRAKAEITKILGNDYEIIEGANLELLDLPNIFHGNSLLSAARKILIRDLSENKPVFASLPDYLNTPHEIIIFETKLDKRSTTYKSLASSVEISEFKAPKNFDQNLVFNIFTIAKKDGKKAIENLEKIKFTQDPMMFFGLMASQAIKDFQANQGTKEKKVLKELSQLDLNLKSSKLSSWLLIESFLLRVSQF